MKIGDKVRIDKKVRRYGGLKGQITKFNDGEIGVKLGNSIVWFLESELDLI